MLRNMTDDPNYADFINFKTIWSQKYAISLDP